MDSPRVRSGNRAVRGYGTPKDSRKIPNGFRGKRNPGRDGQGERLEQQNAERSAKRQAREAHLAPRVEHTRSAEFAWELAIQQLFDWVPLSSLNLWVAPFTCKGEVDGGLYLEAPAHCQSWSVRRYGTLIGDAIREVSDFKGAFLGVAASEENESEDWL